MSPSDTTNADPNAAGTQTAAPVVAAAQPDFIQEIEAKLKADSLTALDKIESLGATLVADVEGFTEKEWPYVRAFILTLISQEGQAALQAGIATAPTGNPTAVAAAVFAAVTGALIANVTKDAQTEINAAEQAQEAAAGTGSGTSA